MLEIVLVISPYSVAFGVILSLLFYPPFASIAKGEVFVLLYVFLFFCLFG